MPRRHMSGLPVARFLMVMGSLSPLFVLWAIRGTREIPDKWWGSFCLACVIIPNLTLYWRWHIAHARNDHRVIIVLSARDQSEHLLVYLFAMLIPLLGSISVEQETSLLSWWHSRSSYFTFWHMNLHYLNVLFALFGYRVFTVEAATSATLGAKNSNTVVVLSKRPSIPPSTQIDTIRVSDTVLVEKG